MDSLWIYEIFSSIQGESTYAGLPCFFIRLAGCNLRCSYCDTKRAQTRERAVEMSVDELERLADEADRPIVELTGGEPLCQKEALCLLAERLIRKHKVLIETNGSMDLACLPPEVIRIVDYKMPSSGESSKMFLENFRKLRPCDEVKFVISDEKDYLFAAEKIREFSMESQTQHILLSPVFGGVPAKDLVEWMLRDRLKARLNLQIHKCIWPPDMEGV